jgi:hypothetical protein
MRDEKRFVPGESYKVLVGGEMNRRQVIVPCKKAGELQLEVMEITEHNRPDITFAGKDVRFMNPLFQRRWKDPRKAVLPRYTPRELVADLHGVTYVDADRILMRA